MKHLALAGALALGLLASTAQAGDRSMTAFWTAATPTAIIFASSHEAPKMNVVQPARSGAVPDLVRAAARRHGVPEALALAVASVESGFDPRARNGTSIGVMQIKVATARGIGCAGDLFDPAVNADCGVRYLARTLARAGGDPRAGAALYNQGEAGSIRAGAGYAARVMARMRRGA